jgi:hypothetical protein
MLYPNKTRRRSSVAPTDRRRELGRLLAASEGYHVLTSDDHDVGLVDHVRYERHSDHPDKIVIRRRNVLRKSRRVIPFAAVASVDPRHRTVALELEAEKVKRSPRP